MAGGLLSAVFGPQLVKLTADEMAVRFLGCYLAVMGLNIVGSLLFLALNIPKPKAPVAGSPLGRSRAELLRNPTILVAMICAFAINIGRIALMAVNSEFYAIAHGQTGAFIADLISALIVISLASFAERLRE